MSVTFYLRRVAVELLLGRVQGLFEHTGDGREDELILVLQTEETETGLVTGTQGFMILSDDSRPVSLITLFSSNRQEIWF